MENVTREIRIIESLSLKAYLGREKLTKGFKGDVLKSKESNAKFIIAEGEDGDNRILWFSKRLSDEIQTGTEIKELDLGSKNMLHFVYTDTGEERFKISAMDNAKRVSFEDIFA